MTTQAFTPQDEAYMTRALLLAARGQGRVEPNPMVGCVIVRPKRIVGEGYHRRFGHSHAEINALRAASPQAKGATAYLTLEPCCHQGKTPPCTDALIAAGIKSVVVAMRDPFPKMRGRSVRLLRSAGIEVATGLCKTEAIRLNGPYLKLQRTGKPWVILKWAQSLDGKIATRTGDSKWISCKWSRQYAHRLRGRVDAIVVGVQTVIADDPQLTCRLCRPKRVATRVVIDPNLRTPKQSKIVRSARSTPTIIVTDQSSAKLQKARSYQRRGVKILGVRRRKTGLDLEQLLDELGRLDMTNIMVEGGGTTLGRFFDAELADEAFIFVSRRLIGGELARSPLAGKGASTMRNIRQPVGTKLTRSGQDDLYHLRLNLHYS